MGLFERIWRVIRANFNELVDRAEDPEKVLEQTVLEMQQHLIEMRQAVAQAIATQKRTERQAAQNETMVEQWRDRAQLALEKGNEILAREALVRGQSYNKNAEALQAQLGQQKGVIERLKRDMRTLESKIADAKTKKDMYIARARSAAASQKIRELADSANTSSSLSAFERMEERVLELESESEAAQALETGSLEEKFVALEEAETDSTQLTKGSTDKAKLPSSESSSVDREMEKLRSEIDSF